LLADHGDVERMVPSRGVTRLACDHAHVVCVVSVRTGAAFGRAAAHARADGPAVTQIDRVRGRGDDELAGEGGAEVEDVRTSRGLGSWRDAAGLRDDGSVASDERPAGTRPRRPSLVAALGGTGYAAIAIPRNSVGAVQLKDNAVTAAKVKNFSLVRQDFRPGQLPAGARGPAGEAGDDLRRRRLEAT
jgi:hypothetical protein